MDVYVFSFLIIYHYSKVHNDDLFAVKIGGSSCCYLYYTVIARTNTMASSNGWPKSNKNSKFSLYDYIISEVCPQLHLLHLGTSIVNVKMFLGHVCQV